MYFYLITIIIYILLKLKVDSYDFRTKLRVLKIGVNLQDIYNN